ncbi:MAG: HD domain-containing protein [Anaerolineales bacterium]|nr:MAG: HD domain-containing protein [Anaerolineales bacterium]
MAIDEARTWYTADDPVHGFDHVLRVLGMAERIGEQLAADMQVLQAAALLHDAAGAHPGGASGRGAHEQASAEFARQVLEEKGWTGERIQAVVHCIRSHRYRNQEEPQTLEAKIIFDADKLDVLGAFGVARTLGYALQAGQPMYARPSKQFMETGEKEQDEPHSAYHEYIFKLRRVKARLFTAPAKEIAEHRHQLMCDFFDQMAVEAEGKD